MARRIRDLNCQAEAALGGLWDNLIMEKKRSKYAGDEPKGVTVARLAHKRYEKAQQLKAERAKKKAKNKQFDGKAFDALMQQLEHVQSKGPYSRAQMNER
jgi:hypothetical protein